MAKKKTTKKKPKPTTKAKAKPIKYTKHLGLSKTQIYFIAGIAVVLLIVVFAYAITSQPEPIPQDPVLGASDEQPEPDWPVLVIIEDSTCGICNSENVADLMKTSFPEVSINTIDSTSPEAQLFISVLEIKALPAYIFNDKIINEDNFTDFAPVLNKKNGQYVVDDKVRGLIVRYFNPPSTVDEPTKGPDSAKVIITEFSDPGCSACKVFNLEIEPRIIETYGDNVKIVFKTMPLSPTTLPASIAFECAYDQNKFWEYMPLVYEHGIANLTTPAEQLSLNMDQFNNCTDQDHVKTKVMQDRDEAVEYGVTGTPTLFINGIRVTGVPAWEDLSGIIDAELAR